MLYLLTAPPGSGKTQFAIERFILDTIRENERDIADWHKNPARQDKPPPLRRQVYTNIKGITRPDRVAKIQAQVGGAPVLLAPDDWRETPDGSMLVYDEAQQKHLFRATGKPGVPYLPNGDEDERITGLDTHRHRGFDIVLVTQEQGLIHHWAKKFVNAHIHLERPNNAEMMTVREWPTVQTNPDDHFAKQAADTSFRRMDRSTWELYDSATVHTHKFKMPAGAKWAVRTFLALVVLLPLGFFGLAKCSGPDAQASPGQEADKRASVEQVTAMLPAGMVALPKPPPPSGINGCVASARSCRCWDFDGVLLPFDEGTCRSYAEGITPMPLNLNLFRSGGQSPGQGGRKGEASPAPADRASSGVGTPPASVGSPTQGAMQGTMPETLRASSG